MRGPGNGIITKDKITKKAPLLNGFGITKTINYYSTYNFNHSTVYTLYINKYRYAMYEYSMYCTLNDKSTVPFLRPFTQHLHYKLRNIFPSISLSLCQVIFSCRHKDLLFNFLITLFFVNKKIKSKNFDVLDSR